MCVIKAAVKEFYDLGVVLHQIEFVLSGMTCFGVNPQTDLGGLMRVFHSKLFYLGWLKLTDQDWRRAEKMGISKIKKRLRGSLSENSMQRLAWETENIFKKRITEWSPVHVKKHPNSHQLKLPKEDRWRLPYVKKPVLLLGDSNLGRITMIPKNLSIQIESFPGANFQDITRLLDRYRGPAPEVLILSVGINDKGRASAVGDVTTLMQCLKKFPNTKILFPEVTSSSKLKSDPSILKNINQQILKECIQKRIQPITTLPEIEFEVNPLDNIHWTSTTAQKMMSLWMRHAN